MNKLSVLDWVALILVIIGALNWGLVGFLQYDLVAGVFGEATTVSRIVYDTVGLSAIYLIFIAPKLGKE